MARARQPRRGPARRRPQRRRARYPPGIAQGVVALPARVFGSNRRKRQGGRNGWANAFNAFHTSHLPLPRAVGPYTVIRTTQVISSNAILSVLGPMQAPGSDYRTGNEYWTNLAGIDFTNANGKLSEANSIYRHAFSAMIGDGWKYASCTPAAYSVQIMNPGALQKTSGIIYIGRIRTMPNLDQDNVSVADFANEFVNYNQPRLCSAGKLALAGVHVDAVPFNMNRLADFSQIEPRAEGTSTFSNKSAAHMGFAPVCVYNPGNVPLQYLVCCEWRVRFDPGNPAQASHVHHAPATDSTWHKAIRRAEAIGNGVVDIATAVAQAGQAASRVASRAAPLMLM